MNPVTARFQVLFRKAGVREQDVEWYPLWLEKYGRFLEHAGYSELIVERDVMITSSDRFLRAGFRLGNDIRPRGRSAASNPES